MSNMNNEIEQCKVAIQSLQEKLKKLQEENSNPVNQYASTSKNVLARSGEEDLQREQSGKNEIVHHIPEAGDIYENTYHREKRFLVETEGSLHIINGEGDDLYITMSDVNNFLNCGYYIYLGNIKQGCKLGW